MLGIATKVFSGGGDVTMSQKTSYVIACLFISVFVAGSALAGNVYWGGHGGLSFYSLSDLNNEIDHFNELAGT
ncbi:MAG: hypothetical protein KJ956_13885 [Actinobacteria bacterium]|nr:hypothetical protein [Actinomycetota bacterium]